ncbi:MAG: DUF2723 domain-containing protein [Polyangiaceae bacterium]
MRRPRRKKKVARKASKAAPRESGPKDDESSEEGPSSDDAPAPKPTKRRKKKGKKKKAPEPEEYRVDPLTDEHQRDFRLGLAIAAVGVTALYYFTACRWIGLGDTAIVIDEMVDLKVNSHVNNHTIAILFGWLFSKLPFGELAFRINLMSVFFGSIAATLVYVIAFRILKRLVPALVATAAVAVMHSLWWHSTIVENYAFNAVCLMGWIICLMKDEESPHSKYYYGACVIAGVAIVNHVQMATLSVGVFIYAILQRKKQDYGLISRWIKMGLWFLVGFLPYLVVLVKDMMASPDATKVLYWATGGDFQSRMFDFEPAKVFRPLLVEFLVQFPSPMLLFIALGIYYVGETSYYGRTSIAVTVVFLINTGFFALFHTWDKFAFLLPSFLAFAYWGIVGMRFAYEWAAERKEELRERLTYGVHALVGLCVIVPPWFYASLAKWGLDEGFWHSRFNNNYTVNTHNCATYIANPNKAGWDEVDQFSHLLFEKLPERAVFMDDDSRVYYPLKNYFQKYYGLRKDMTILLMNTWGFSGWGMTEDQFVSYVRANVRARPIFLVAIEHPFQGTIDKLRQFDIVPRRFDLSDDRWVYQLVPEDTLPAGALVVSDMITGRGFDQGVPVLKWAFGPHEVIAAKARFKKNTKPVTVEFVWRGPDGKEHFRSEPFVVEPDNTDVFSYLDDGKNRPPGRYEVALVADGKEVYSTHFTVR